ncbi:hypothetical protein GBA52_022547 [Prunus armeniaca]|nr:hypothetical protein GBA52_022547 [Prunus armeniaca]
MARGARPAISLAPLVVGMMWMPSVPETQQVGGFGLGEVGVLVFVLGVRPRAPEGRQADQMPCGLHMS